MIQLSIDGDDEAFIEEFEAFLMKNGVKPIRRQVARAALKALSESSPEKQLELIMGSEKPQGRPRTY